MAIRLLAISAGKTEVPQHLSGFSLETVHSGLEALDHLKVACVDVVLASFPLPDWTAEELLEEIQRINPLAPVVIRDANGSLADAVRLTRQGAYHFTGYAPDSEELGRMLEAAAEYRRSRELASLGSHLASEPWKKFLIGESREMQNIAGLIRLVGARRATVLITGETGAGKEMVARAIHLASGRSHLPMVAVNCNALPSNLLEAELFGHVKGAFTGAVNHRIGRFEQAHRSSIFLDEIGDLPLEMQPKLLRVLQEREFQRIGSSETIRVDTRVIAASNSDLTVALEQKTFREDLYYRLNVVPIHVPPLRNRASDIPLLVYHFVDKICRQEEVALKQVPPETLERLERYSWPGNVRQLENAVEMAIALSGDREALYPSDFPLPPARPATTGCPSAAPMITVPDEGLDFEQLVSHMERTILEQALRKTRGNKAQAAGMLRLKRTTLSAKLRSLAATG